MMKSTKNTQQNRKNTRTVMSTERTYAYTLERVKAWLSVACDKAVAKDGYFKPVYLPDKWTVDNARKCVAKMREARTRIAKWLGNSEFLDKAIAYFEKQVNAPTPVQAPAPQEPKRKAVKARKSKAQREQDNTQGAYMRVAKAVKAGTLKTDGKFLFYKTEGAYNDCARLVDAIGIPATVEYVASKM